MDNVVQFADIRQDTQEAQTLHCTKCGTQHEAKCSCGVGCIYMTKKDAAARSRTAHPDWTDIQIAEAIGVSNSTVNRAKDQLSQDEKVGKRTGKDGKQRPATYKKRNKDKPPRPREGKRGQGPAPQLDKAREIIRPLLEAGKTISPHKLEKEHGISHVTFDMALTAETARRKAIEEAKAALTEEALAAAIEAQLPKSAKEKLDAADRARAKKRAQEEEAEFTRRVQEHLARVVPGVQEAKNKAFEAERRYQKFMASQKKIFTPQQWMKIWRCLHPDNSASAETRTEAFQLFEEKVEALTGYKKDEIKWN